MPANWATLIVLSFVLAAARFFVPGHPLSLAGTYEAFAHLFVGGLIGAWLATRDYRYLLFLGALTLVELFAFFTGV